MIEPITEDEFDELLRSFKRSAFRLESRSHYALGYEQADFDRFLAGTPVPPPELAWWRPWLEQIKRLTAEGKTVSRVRVLDEPPSDYQRWELWAAPWHAQAGEQIGYMSRSHALQSGLTLLAFDWWLLDDECVIAMWFNRAGEIDHKTLITARGIVDTHIRWRDLAVRNATTAEAIAAA